MERNWQEIYKDMTTEQRWQFLCVMMERRKRAHLHKRFKDTFAYTAGWSELHKIMVVTLGVILASVMLATPVDVGSYAVNLASALTVIVVAFLLLSYLTQSVPRYRSYNIPALTLSASYILIAPALLIANPPFIAAVGVLIGISMIIATFAQMTAYFIAAAWQRAHWI